MKAFDDVIKLIQDYIDNDQPDMAVVDELVKIAKKGMYAAAQSKRTKNDTMNQITAYAWAVYYNKKRIKGGINDKDEAALDNPRLGPKGHWTAIQHLQRFVPEDNGYVVYIANGMFYSAIHEYWGMPIITQELTRTASEIAQTFDVDVQIKFEEHFYKDKKTHYVYG